MESLDGSLDHWQQTTGGMGDLDKMREVEIVFDILMAVSAGIIPHKKE